MELSSKFTGNCLPLDNIPILSGAQSLDKINNTSIGYRLEVSEERNLSESEILNNIRSGKFSKISNKLQ